MFMVQSYKWLVEYLNVFLKRKGVLSQYLAKIRGLSVSLEMYDYFRDSIVKQPAKFQNHRLTLASKPAGSSLRETLK